jgi:hypothetical protein
MRFITIIKVVPTVAIQKLRAQKALWERRLAATPKATKSVMSRRDAAPTRNHAHQELPVTVAVY